MAETLSVARSNLYTRPDEPSGKRGAYTKQADGELLALIADIVDERPTYGYRRVCAILNRKLEERQMPAVNHKRIYRLMKAEGLLLVQLPKHSERRLHTGKIIAEKSDRRWCGDGFEIVCNNGERIRSIFVMDCCDREIISLVASTGGYTSEMAQNAILAAVEKRFGNNRARHPVEWLTDNGSCFTAGETRELARDIGIINCFTPVRSPESNGMAESFVKTFKRDYASCNTLATADQVLEQMREWVEDYNENAPHKGLKWLSPRQFRRKAFSEGNFPGAARGQEAA